ncbi:MAG: hypothetical protein ACYCXG_11795 [Acidiferrobacter sp.]
MTKQREIVGIFGQAGHGKSTMIRHMIRPLPRVLIVDVGLEDYDGVMQVGSLPLAARLIDGKTRYRLSYGDLDRSDEECMDDAVALTRAYADTLTGAGLPQMMVIDEADRYAPARGMGRAIREAVARGRHWSLSIIYATRRPAEVNRLLTSQTTRFIVFRTREPGDLRYLRAFIGEEAADRAPDLVKFQYLDIAEDGSWVVGRLPDPQPVVS